MRVVGVRCRGSQLLAVTLARVIKEKDVLEYFALFGSIADNAVITLNTQEVGASRCGDV